MAQRRLATGRAVLQSTTNGVGVNTELLSDRADLPVFGIEPVANLSLSFQIEHPVPPHFSDRDRRIVHVGRKRSSEANRRTMTNGSPGGWAGERRLPRPSWSQQRQDGNLDPSHFFARADGASEAPADGLGDRVAPQDFAGDDGWPGADVGGSPCSDRRDRSNGAHGHSGDRSKTAGCRCGKSAEVK
jgi:hypothetical protein